MFIYCSKVMKGRCGTYKANEIYSCICWIRAHFMCKNKRKFQPVANSFLLPSLKIPCLHRLLPSRPSSSAFQDRRKQVHKFAESGCRTMISAVQNLVLFWMLDMQLTHCSGLPYSSSCLNFFWLVLILSNHFLSSSWMWVPLAAWTCGFHAPQSLS